MTATYDGNLQVLRSEVETGGARSSAIDAHVNALVIEGGESLAADLLSLLSDMAEYDEGMFSIVHAAESVDDAPFVSALLSVFPQISVDSPRWASIIPMRVLNSVEAQLELVRQFREASAPIKQAIRLMCERINQVSPEFLRKTVPATLAAA